MNAVLQDMMKLVSTTSRNKSVCVLIFVLFLGVIVMHNVNKHFCCAGQGYSCTVDGIPTDIHGALAAVSADNLGSLALGGFKESCTAYRCCRHCMATLDMARSKVHNFYST